MTGPAETGQDVAMEKYHIKLTEDEAALLQRIDLRDNHRDHNEGRAAYLNNQEPILALLQSLSARKAIPESRLSWWGDPRFNQGRLKGSRKQIFERNGAAARDIYTSPHFVSHLRYFLFGADLPDQVIAAFEESVGDPQWVTSSDIVPLGKAARDLTRRFHLDRGAAPGEFFKLCIDMGLSLMAAESITASVKQVR